jgi:hypothetical protein
MRDRLVAKTLNCDESTIRRILDDYQRTTIISPAAITRNCGSARSTLQPKEQVDPQHPGSNA